MILQAHRGASLHYPENTFPAYYGAIDEQFSFIELDTKFTKDNKCVLIHDRTVNRTGRKPDGSVFDTPVNVCDLTLDELKQLDFGLHKSEKFKGTKIPELSELLDFVKQTKMPIKFDNVIQTATDGQLEYFFAMIEACGAEEYIGITAKDVDFAAKVTSRLSVCRIHYDGPTSPEIYEQLKIAVKGHPLSIWLPSEKKSWLPYPPATVGDVKLARQYGSVGLWTAHDRQSLDYIMSLSPDAMEIDGEITPQDVLNYKK